MHPSMFPYNHQPPPSREGNERELKVIGEGRITAVPDGISIIIGVRTENLSVQQALKENTTVSNTMIDGFQNAGIEQSDIETASFTINPKYDYTDGKTTLVGYEVQHLFEVHVADIKQAGEVYAISVASGGNVAEDIRFFVKDPTPYEKQALSQAVQHAGEKATAIADTLGVALNPIPLEVTERTQQPPGGYVVAAKTLGSAPPIQTQSLTVVSAVEVTYRY
ncbi:SIMPL domain-containing protein [Priestia flexa]|jgi:uncharacterized protein|uniref:SIMPL domain-containing protein n=1 Tax=Priestia flexa TaxID=86664 RepID=A0A8I1MG24_9BACI|nr:SIMPL domain-containing protein [Priestia flexa]MBN8252402.1 SIMPL domain-containing protein [Priestia flexa]MBN8433872.1 SIMPL domain-containing protein [Priestia flexa]MCA0966402.1 SIMPL domain-containing protein [Priestia flexa]MCG7312860.1 SIMPL domain-containing protein [Priestia flexa]MCM3065691.1 SIMPL domain-containing protein [Priestia flexa]